MDLLMLLGISLFVGGAVGYIVLCFYDYYLLNDVDLFQLLSDSIF